MTASVKINKRLLEPFCVWIKRDKVTHTSHLSEDREKRAQTERNQGPSCLTTRTNQLQHHSISTSTHLLLLLPPPIPNYIPTLYLKLYYTTEPCPPTHHTFPKTEVRAKTESNQGPPQLTTRSNRLQHHSISTSTHLLLLLPAPTPNNIPTQDLTLYHTTENDSCVKMGSDASLTA